MLSKSLWDWATNGILEQLLVASAILTLPVLTHLKALQWNHPQGWSSHLTGAVWCDSINSYVARLSVWDRNKLSTNKFKTEWCERHLVATDNVIESVLDTPHTVIQWLVWSGGRHWTLLFSRYFWLYFLSWWQSDSATQLKLPRQYILVKASCVCQGMALPPKDEQIKCTTYE